MNPSPPSLHTSLSAGSHLSMLSHKASLSMNSMRSCSVGVSFASWTLRDLQTCDSPSSSNRTSPSPQPFPLPPALNQAFLQSASQTLPFMHTLLLALALFLHLLPSHLASGAFPRVVLRLPKLTLWSIALVWRNTSRTRASLSQSLLPRLLPIPLLLSLQARQVHPDPLFTS